MLRLLLAGLLVALFAESASACSCRRDSADDAYSKARAIFVGEITEAAVVKSSDVIRAAVRVNEVVKGSPDAISFVESGIAQPASCDLHLLKGQSYLFVLFKTNFVSWCDSGPVTSRPYRDWLLEYRDLRDRPKQ